MIEESITSRYALARGPTVTVLVDIARDADVGRAEALSANRRAPGERRLATFG
jgi:hypothetical protein